MPATNDSNRHRRWVDGSGGDFRHAVRALMRNRSFGTVAVLVLAASVAVNTLIFFMLEGVVLRPLPYGSAGRLVRLYDASESQPKFPLAIGHYLDYRANARSLDGIALYTGSDVQLSGVDGGSQQLTGVAITSDYFSVLGKAPMLGRAFADEDLRRNVRNVILSHRLWRDRFDSDPAIVGKSIRLDREAWTIVGVAPPGFQHVGGEYRSPLQGETVDVWLPLRVDVTERAQFAFHYCNAIARVREGFTEAQARDEVGRLAALSAQRLPQYGAWRARMEPLLGEVTGKSRQVVWLLAVAGGIVLLVACANIAGLAVARAGARRHELSLRRALGASRWRLLRVGLAENVIVGVIGAILGLLLAAAGLPLLRTLLPSDFPRAHEIALTWSAALFAAGIAIATVVVAGLLPSVGGEALLAQTRTTAGRESRRRRTALVVGEVALAGVLCAGALFLLRSYLELGAREHGFVPESALTFRLVVPARDPEPGYFARVQEEIRGRIAAIPGVRSVGASTNLPWSGYDENTSFGIVGRESDAADGPSARFQAAGPGYFEAAGMTLVSGRLFDRTRDVAGQPFTVIVNDALAERYFQGGDAVGSLVNLWGERRQIVGVVKAIKDFPADMDAKPGFWFPLGQVAFSNTFFVVRTHGLDPAALTPQIAAAVRGVDPELPLADVRTLESRAAAALASRRFALWLFQAFAVLALVLAAAGIYGLLAYLVRQRRKELGIRVALGATRGDLRSMILGDGLRMAGAGALASLLLIPLGGRFLQGFLFNVGAFDPFTIATAPVVLLVVCFLASLFPALSATRSDPAVALRED
jgi:predicted permease